MTVGMIEEWYRGLPAFEREMPLVTLKGKTYTPDQILEEVRGGTEVGRELQRKVERRELASDITALAKKRALKMIQERPAGVAWLAKPGWPKTLSPEEVKEEIREETEIGKEFIQMEKTYMRRLMG